ncbi:hypothetical protein HPB47_016455, partial [Ixodes persulcatus]
MNPLVLKQKLGSLALAPDGVIQIRPNYRLNLLAIDARNVESTKALLQLKNLGAVKVQTYEPPPPSASAGIIRGVSADIEDGYLLAPMREKASAIQAQRCGRCGGDNGVNECAAEQPKCTNCKKRHDAASKVCAIYKVERQITNYKSSKNVNYTSAKSAIQNDQEAKLLQTPQQLPQYSLDRALSLLVLQQLPQTKRPFKRSGPANPKAHSRDKPDERFTRQKPRCLLRRRGATTPQPAAIAIGADHSINVSGEDQRTAEKGPSLPSATNAWIAVIKFRLAPNRDLVDCDLILAHRCELSEKQRTREESQLYEVWVGTARPRLASILGFGSPEQRVTFTSADDVPSVKRRAAEFEIESWDLRRWTAERIAGSGLKQRKGSESGAASIVNITVSHINERLGHLLAGMNKHRGLTLAKLELCSQ